MNNLTIKILNKEYQISCPAGSELELQHAANYLDTKITEIRNNGRIISFEGMLITACINLAYEVLQQNIKLSTNNKDLTDNLAALQDKLNSALQKPLCRTKLKFEYNE